MRGCRAGGAGRDRVLSQKRTAIRAGVRTTLGLWIDGEWFEEDALEQAVIDRVIVPLRNAEAGRPSS